MQPRQTLSDLFSTFIRFASDRFSGWMVDPPLRRNLQAVLPDPSVPSADLDAEEAFWSLYWYRQWSATGDRLSLGHLSAYLQEPCYWAVHRLMVQRTGTQWLLSDCFQRAIADVPSVLNGYNSRQGASLKTYASLCFGNLVRDTLRQHGEADSRSTWGLLRKVSHKRLTEALRAAGFAEERIATYRLAWSCFKTCWGPTESPATRQLASPDRQTWEAIATLYNAQRGKQLEFDTPQTTPELLEQWLTSCAQRIRAYLNPPTTSLNVQTWDEGSGEALDELPDQTEASPLQHLISQDEIAERQAQRQQIREVLTTAFTELKPELRTVIELYYRDRLTQQQIAAQLEMKQYTVSRRLSSAKEALLLAIARWSQTTLHISLTSPVIHEMSLMLDEWLQHSFAPAAGIGDFEREGEIQ